MEKEEVLKKKEEELAKRTGELKKFIFFEFENIFSVIITNCRRAGEGAGGARGDSEALRRQGR